MHYGQFAEWVRDKVEELVAFGVPREEAEALAKYVERGAIAAEAAAREDRQFLIEFERVGSIEMARRSAKTPQAMCQKRTRILAKLNPELSARFNCA